MNTIIIEPVRTIHLDIYDKIPTQDGREEIHLENREVLNWNRCEYHEHRCVI